MKSMNATRKILNATVLETERGLFQVTYRAQTASPELEEMPVYQIGIDIAQVKQGIEKIAKQLGFDGVIWDTARQTPSSGDALNRRHLPYPSSRQSMKPPSPHQRRHSPSPRRSAPIRPRVASPDAAPTLRGKSGSTAAAATSEWPQHQTEA